MEPHNIKQIPEAFMLHAKDGAHTSQLSRFAGGQRLNVSLDVLPAGTHSAKYHAHSRQEEFFLILAGHGVLRTPEGERPVGPGDFMAIPATAGFDTPHNLFNPGPEPLEILDIELVDAGDVAYYPDEDIYALRGGRPVFFGGDALKGWTSEPE